MTLLDKQVDCNLLAMGTIVPIVLRTHKFPRNDVCSHLRIPPGIRKRSNIVTGIEPTIILWTYVTRGSPLELHMDLHTIAVSNVRCVSLPIWAYGLCDIMEDDS